MLKTFFDILYIFGGDKFRREKLFDYRNKLSELKRARPDLKFNSVRMIKGGWNIGFIVDNSRVFKIRKFYDNENGEEKIIREKRITDAFEKISPIKIPKITITKTDKYVFYEYEYINGKNLNKMPLWKIRKHKESLAKQIAEFIYAIYNSNPVEINDLKDGVNGGWIHNDLCNNMIVNPRSMKIVGIIDWEYAKYDTIEKEFERIDKYSSKMKKSKLRKAVIKRHSRFTYNITQENPTV